MAGVGLLLTVHENGRNPQRRGKANPTLVARGAAGLPVHPSRAGSSQSQDPKARSEIAFQMSTGFDMPPIVGAT